MIPALINKAHDLGFEVTLGDAFRDPRVHGEFGVKLGYGARLSLHKKRLALDLNLFKDGEYLPDTESHKDLGEWWEDQGGSWGGRFKVPDGNHYELSGNK
jgi:hypothetical protein